ncbi:ABC transporter permease [Pararhodospirillum photometricum]|nr:ABC transporter permease [Pararhodospirillum photometricum]
MSGVLEQGLTWRGWRWVVREGKTLPTFPHAVFLAGVAALMWPTAEAPPWRVLTLITLIDAGVLAAGLTARRPEIRVAAGDVGVVLFVLLLAWHGVTAWAGLVDPLLIPAPEVILALFVAELPDMTAGLWGSLARLGLGVGLALVTAIPLGLIVGWNRRLFRAVHPFTKVLGTIPPVVYIPYAIHFLPSFKLAAILVVFVGAFWPLFINTLRGVAHIPGPVIDAARVLTLRPVPLLLRVILPATLPSICTGATLALCFSFLMLTAAEVIGGSSGIGWYVNNFADFADYHRVIVGILFIALVVSVVTWGTERLERRLLRWHR